MGNVWRWCRGALALAVVVPMWWLMPPPSADASYCVWGSVSVLNGSSSTVRSGSTCPSLPPEDFRDPCDPYGGIGTSATAPANNQVGFVVCTS